MAKKEIYTEYPVVPIKSVVFHEWQNERIGVAEAPFKPGFEQALSFVATARKTKLGEKRSPIKQVSVSPYHGRSMEVRFGEHGSVQFADSYGNIFRSISRKGGFVTFPYAMYDSLSHSGFAVNGMMDSDSIIRCIRASALMRAVNIDTEVILAVEEPQEVPYRGKLVSREAFKDKLVRAAWKRNSKETEKVGRGPLARRDVADFKAAFDKTTFVIITRASRAGERVADLLRCQTKPELKAVMKNVFQAVTARQKALALKDPTYEPMYFNEDCDEDIARYITVILPGMIGRNYGRLHNLGLAHKYSHLGNIFATGGIADLDSMHGEALRLEDTKVTPEELRHDLSEFLDWQHDTNAFVGIPQFLALLEWKKFIPEKRNNYRQFRSQVFYNYLSERKFDEIIPHLRIVEEGLNAIGINAVQELGQTIYPQLISELGWDYEARHDFPEIINGFYINDEKNISARLEGARKNYPDLTVQEHLKKALRGKLSYDDLFSKDPQDRLCQYFKRVFIREFRRHEPDKWKEMVEKYGIVSAQCVVNLFFDREFIDFMEYIKKRDVQISLLATTGENISKILKKV